MFRTLGALFIIMEIWKDVVGYEGLYQVSNQGRVKSYAHLVKCRNGHRTQPSKVLTNCFDGNYYHVTLFKNNKRKVALVHRLVADAFISNPLNKETVNHIDGNKKNNFVGNLEWATNSENTQHAFKTGLSTAQITHFRGVIAFKYPDGSFVGEYKSQHEAAKVLGLNVGHICSVLRGRAKQTMGYYFEYSNKEKLQNRIY